MTAKALSLRPSDLVGIENVPENDYERFELDRAVTGLGTYIDGKLEEITKDGKRKYKTVAEVLATVVKGRRKAKPKAKPGAFKPPTFRRKIRDRAQNERPTR